MFFLFILIILLVTCCIIYTSKVGVEVQNLIIDTEKPKGERINKDSKIYVYILIFGKIKLFKNNVRDFNKHIIKLKNKDIDIKFFSDRDVKVNYKDLIRKLDIYFDKLDLNIQIGTEDAALTAVLTGIISAGLGIIIKKSRYEIIPIYANKNFLKIKLDCIFSVHLMQYIFKLISNNIIDLRKENLNKKAEV